MEKLVKDQPDIGADLRLQKSKRSKNEKQKDRGFIKRLNDKSGKAKTGDEKDSEKEERIKLAKLDDPTAEKHEEDMVKPDSSKGDSPIEGNVDFFGTKALERTKLRNDGIVSGESDDKRASRYSKVMKQSNFQLQALKKQETERLLKINRDCDSEDKLDKSLDYQRLISSISRQQVCRQIQKDISYHIGNDYMERAFEIAENKRRVERELSNLHHVEFTIKRRYQEVSPDTGVTFKDKLKSKAFINTTYQFREHTGGFVDQET